MKVLISFEVNELSDSDINLDKAVADITLYPSSELSNSYSNRIGRYFGVKVIPLPKGHGKLIDADKLDFSDIDFYDPHCVYDVDNVIDNAPTIIEADETESERK